MAPSKKKNLLAIGITELVQAIYSIQKKLDKLLLFEKKKNTNRGRVRTIGSELATPGRPPGKRGPGRPPGKKGPGRPVMKSDTDEAPVKRGRGRPRKIKTGNDANTTASRQVVVKRKRGRPKKTAI